MSGSSIALAGDAGIGSKAGARGVGWPIAVALMAAAAFALYWASSFHLEATHRTTHFGGDTWFYAELAKGDVMSRVAGNYYLDRIFRFHPTTVVLGASWMAVLHPLTAWISPEHLLKAMFAVVGAVGAGAATLAFAAVVPRRSALLLGAMYASSLSVWYFSSLEESKIVTATLTALYLAVYLRLRKDWTLRGALLLTGILLVTCLNETVAAFLIAIPLIDTLVEHGWAWRNVRRVVGHALAVPVAVAILEGLMRARTGAAGYHPEGANHLSMLIYYISHNYYSWENTYTFLLRWLVFSFAAPSRDATYMADPGVNYGGDFAPTLLPYLASPVSIALVVALAAAVAVSVIPRYRGEAVGGLRAVLAALAVYALARGVFFGIFMPWESLLFSPAIMLTHLMLLGIPVALSRFPARDGLLAAVAALLLATNGAFVLGT